MPRCVSRARPHCAPFCAPVCARVSCSCATPRRNAANAANALPCNPAALRTGTKHETKCVIVTLDEFDLFAHPGKQSLLYNLLDTAQSGQTPLSVIGMSCRFDAEDLLEKRVLSRFSRRKLYVASSPPPIASACVPDAGPAPVSASSPPRTRWPRTMSVGSPPRAHASRHSLQTYRHSGLRSFPCSPAWILTRHTRSPGTCGHAATRPHGYAVTRWWWWWCALGGVAVAHWQVPVQHGELHRVRVANNQAVMRHPNGPFFLVSLAPTPLAEGPRGARPRRSKRTRLDRRSY